MRHCYPLVVVAMMTTTLSAQRYELVEPTGVVAATARIERGRLQVRELATGQRLSFVRERRYDSPDGRLAGYFCFDLNRALRFPRTGFGKMQVAELRDAAPRFRYTRRSVRLVSNNTRPPIGEPLPGPGQLPGYYPGYGSNRGGWHWLPDPGSLPPYPTHLPAVPIVPVAPIVVAPQSVLIDSKVIPHPPLPPVQLELFNGSPRELQVSIIDLQNPSAEQSVRIAPGKVTRMQAERDAGGTRVERYRTWSAFGDPITKEVTRPIPPAIRYEIVVRQWEVQSIAIDRTGKSPNTIEDVNYQGKGVGRFRLPPGDQLRSQRIDVYQGAVQSGNRGTVPPILAQEDPRPAASPVERALLEAQQRAQREAQRRRIERSGR